MMCLEQASNPALTTSASNRAVVPGPSLPDTTQLDTTGVSMALSKKGGPKKKDGERYKCGLRMAPPDLGTTEQQLKRELAAGTRSIPETGRWGDTLDTIAQGKHSMTRTGTDALDILLARRIIDRDQFEVALDFTACWCACFGRPWPKGWKAERQSPDYDGGVSESHLKRMKVRYWNCLAAMELADRTIYPIVRDVIIHGKMLGLVEAVLAFDVVRQDIDGGGLINRRGATIPPSLRSRIGRLTKGLDIIADSPRGDYSREAEAMMERIRERDPMPPLTRP